MLIPADDPLAVAATAAVQSGDLAGLELLLRDHPDLATVRIGTDGPDGMARTLLHAATDWPGNFPNNRTVVRMLLEAGADVNARFSGPHTETPLHWAASSDDVDVLDSLLDAGADIDATGGVIGGGTALNDATAFAQWNAARRLVERGARARHCGTQQRSGSWITSMRTSRPAPNHLRRSSPSRSGPRVTVGSGPSRSTSSNEVLTRAGSAMTA